MKVIAFSGGGFKLVQHLAAYSEIRKTYKPDTFIGVSAGAIATMICANDLHEDERVLDLVMSKGIAKRVFGGWRTNPFTKKGKVSASVIAHAILHGSLGDYAALEKTLMSVITKEVFYLSPDCGVLVVDKDTGKRHMVWSTDVNYYHWIDAVIASCSIPGIVPPKKFMFRDKYLFKCLVSAQGFDGGLRDHSPAAWLSDYINTNQIKELIDVYTRPQFINQYLTPYDGKNIVKNVLRAVEIQQNEISKGDEGDVASIFGDKVHQFFCPQVLSGTFDTDPKTLRAAYYETKESIKHQINGTK